MKEEEVSIYKFHRVRRLEKNKREVGDPKIAPFKVQSPPPTCHCLGLFHQQISKSSALEEVDGGQCSWVGWEEAVFLPVLLTSSLLLSSSLDKHPHVYAAILGNYSIFTLLLPWTWYEAWYSTTWRGFSPVIITKTALLTQMLHFRMQRGLEGYIETGQWSPKDRPRNGIPHVVEQVLSFRSRGKLHLRN